MPAGSRASTLPHADVVPIAALAPRDRDAMFALMDLVYAGMRRDAFEADLAAKDEAVVLRAGGDLVGFSTQRLLTVAGVSGVFSGDTVIHPEHRGGSALVLAFAQRYIVQAPQVLHWFLVSKGHRTYRMLPGFLTTYWPSRHAPTPPDAQATMTAYAEALFPGDYDRDTGVLRYRRPKDRLRETRLTEQELADPDVAFFVQRNPGWVLGHDLVCLAELSAANLGGRAGAALLG